MRFIPVWLQPVQTFRWKGPGDFQCPGSVSYTHLGAGSANLQRALAGRAGFGAGGPGAPHGAFSGAAFGR